MFSSVLYFGRQNCKYSKILEKYLKNNSRKFVSIKSNFKKEVIKQKLISNKKFDYIFCFRSYFILNKKILNNCKYAINFHPSLPKYRGVGGVNYAIYNKDKFFGSTIHLMDKKIDNGKILKINKFRISKTDNVETLLDKTHKSMFFEAKKFISQIIRNQNILEILSKKTKVQWSKKYYNLKSLDEFYKINPNISKKLLERKLRSTIYQNYKPYILVHGIKFLIKQN